MSHNVSFVPVRNFDLYDRLIGGNFASLLWEWRNTDGDSLADIVHRLRDEHDIKVSVETVRRWLARINAGM